MKSVFSVSAIVLFVLNAWAGLGEDFRDLKNSGVNYEVVGAVCEEVARLRFQEEFPAPRFGVITGVEYGDGSRTIGELDVVVFEASTNRVLRVAEVKCWKDNNGAIAKARDQRQRFIRTLQSGRPVHFRSLHSQVQFRKDNFLQNREFMAVAPKGSMAAGFDRELSYELKELMELRQMMIQCQAKRACAPAQH
jgi:hypothetical protein